MTDNRIRWPDNFFDWYYIERPAQIMRELVTYPNPCATLAPQCFLSESERRVRGEYRETVFACGKVSR